MMIAAMRRTALCAVSALTLCALGPSQTAVVTVLGPGCGTPEPMLAVTPPVIGGTTSFSLTSSLPHAMVFMGVSDPIDPPYPSIGGCPIYLDLATLEVFSLGSTSLSGDFKLDVPIPLSVSILGMSKHVQFLLWPMGMGGDGFSAGVSLTVGLPQTPCTLTDSSISSNFNGTPIALGSTIWFNAIVKSNGIPASGGIVHFDGSTIEFTASGVPYVLNVPPSLIVYDPAATMAETHFDVPTGEWRTTVPADYTGNVFLSGLGFAVNVALPGGVNPVTWTGSFATNVPGIGFQWKWAAAVYTMFSSDPNAIGAKPVDGNSLSIYANSDHAGTPEAFKSFVTGGARGGGGSDFTGSYSATGSADCQ